MWLRYEIEKLRNNFSEKNNFGYHLDKAREQFSELLIDMKKEQDPENFSDSYIADIIHNIADNLCPVMTYDILQIASNHLELATSEPDILAFDGKNTGANCIAGNMYEAICCDLEYYWEEIHTLYV